MSRKTFEKQIDQIEKNQPSKCDDEGMPPGTTVTGFEWCHSDPKICQALPKRGFAGEKVHVFMYNPADLIEVFDGKSNMKLVKCGWCNHFLKDCNGALYWSFDLENIRSAQRI